MSRWIQQFENHPFQDSWKKILLLSEDLIVDDATVLTNVQEIARFKKVTVFLEKLLNSCDPELIPETTWATYHSQANACLKQMTSYQSNRNVGHIKNANANLDNLLTYIRPYQVVAGKAAQSASASFVAYTKTINTHMSSFQENADELLQEVKVIKDEVSSHATETEQTSFRIKELETEYFADTEDELSLHSRIHNFEEQVEESYEKIHNYKTELIDGNDEQRSISDQVSSAFDSANKNSNLVSNLLSEIEKKLSEFNRYYFTIFGKLNEDGTYEGGLKNEIKAREKHLESFKVQQENKYETLNDEIESLLPGATSAGLASAYHELKHSFDSSISNYSKLFYGSIACLMLVSIISITQKVGWFYIDFVDVTDLKKLLSNVLYKLPIVLPILWLTLFASKRRSETLRLQQEYAHKEALAKSYQSFKAQIEMLNNSDPKLMEKLLHSAIEAVSKNASDTLDKKHGDKTPVHEGVDGLVSSVEKIKKVLAI